MAFLTQNKAKVCKIYFITLFLFRKTPFVAKNCRKIAENCDFKIDPKLGFIRKLRPKWFHKNDPRASLHVMEST
jgi:hypothetical protein